MAIRALSLVKNECDVVAQSLTAAALWADAIYVYDNGSDDGTWEIVHELAATSPEIVPYRSEARPYSQALRKDLFEVYRERGARGDWWCQLDADEFYLDDPRSFLAAVPEPYDEVWSASFEYYFTDLDAARYAEDPSAYADDVPVAEKCRYFVNNHSEPRFFRDTERLEWWEGGWPDRLGPAHPRRIRLKHFQYRSPEQIEKRIETRRESFARGSFLHEQFPDWQRAVLDPLRADFGASRPENAPTSWHDRVIPASLLVEDHGDGPYVVNEAALGRIPRWRPAWERWLRARARPLRHVLRRSHGAR
jgi:glycosyltransferase involved in cell wall biosynthesis